MVPFQRGLVLAGQAKGTQPFNLQAPRYEGYRREATSRRAPAGRGTAWSPASGLSLPRPAWLADAPSPPSPQDLARDGDGWRICAHRAGPLRRGHDAEHGCRRLRPAPERSNRGTTLRRRGRP
jgi:hypothetical protein